MNWAGNVAFGAREAVYPASLAELVEVVARAGPSGVKAFGRGHSFSRVGDTSGVLVSLREMPWVCEAVRGREGVPTGVRVGSGLTFGDLCPVLDGFGGALPALASLPHISVAGACATGTHGSGWGARCVASGVREATLVAGDGSVRRVTREDRSFPGVAVSLGALGVVVELVLDVLDSFDMKQFVFEGLPFSSLVERLEEVLGAGYSVSVFWALGDTADVWVKQRVGDEGWDLSGSGARPARTQRHPVPGFPAAHCTPQLGARAPWFELLPHFRAGFEPATGDELQSEYAMPSKNGARALEAIASIKDQVARVVRTVEVRSVAADECWLSPAYGQSTVTVHFTWLPDLHRVEQAVRHVEEALGPLGARPHWGKLFAMDPPTVAGLYPRWRDFRKLLEKFDPEGRFRNPMIDSLFPRG
ncbi:D-arabinono-1,4-lactone oxidase [Streptomyces sp. NPDC127084]|uniref:D-arabinono-1,4-lactone oxidase n=1 Tax=Streptomyces sp. NPDC127084 TaxID=3347133 RepID=UPI00364B59A9